MVRKKPYLSPLLKQWPFANDFRNETEDGKVLSALCKYCSEVEYKDFMQEARSRNINGSALKSICFLQENITYIHRSTFACYVRTSTSLHHWGKEKNRGNSIIDEQPESTSSIPGQKRVDETRWKFAFYSYFYLCRTCMVRYMPAWKTIWDAWNVRCTILYANMLLYAQKNVYQDF